MKFLIAPEYDRVYDMRVAHLLGRALASYGHHYDIMPVTGYDIADAKGYDVFLGVNRPRPEPLYKEIAYIAWIQDYRPIQSVDYAGMAGDNDIIYTLGSEKWIGFTDPGPRYGGSLLMGVEPELLTLGPIEQTLDFSICGYITLPLTKIDLQPSARICLQELQNLYKPLTGSSNAFMMAEAMKRFIDKQIATGKVPEKDREDASKECDWLSIEYCRYIDRLRLAQMAYFVSSKCGFYGVNWQKYYQFTNCVHSPIKDEKRLQEVYRQSKINLHCNWNGFGLHHRVLEAIAVGGFVMAHTCSDPQAPGRITTDFDPDVHFGEYTPENFVERARYWLANDDARAKAVKEARKIVLAKHLWKHRAEQILSDLRSM